ncbi:MAG: N-acetyl-gamma-glutamyl-phosphate reductase, partial [Gammaproteobacteria bacterium]
MSASLPVTVLGGTGYVAGELLRLISNHPRLHLGAAVSTSRAGQPVSASFGHLASAYPDAKFVSVDEAVSRVGDTADGIVVSAAPHGASAELVDKLLNAAEAAGTGMTVVDASADFRYASAESFESV